jgi:hypothetical protein
MWKFRVAIPGCAVGALGAPLAVAGLLVTGTGCVEETPSTFVPPSDFGTMDCSCGDGRDGECPCISAECSVCKSACSCTHCPSFAPEPSQPFDACGGQPLGTWVTTAFPQADFELTRFVFQEVAGRCRTEFVGGPGTFEFRVTLGNASTARYDISAASVKFAGLRDCLGGGGNADCETIGAAHEELKNCWDTGCGICQCESSVVPTNADGTWESSGNLLRFGLPSAPAPFDWTAPFEYCVRGDTLELRHTYSDLRYALTRVTTP